MQEASPQNKRVVVTGATGFIGRRVCHFLKIREYPASRLLRQQEHIGTGDFFYDLETTEPDGEWFDGASALVHCAARVHVTGKHAAGDFHAFKRANVDATVALAQHAIASGVPHIVFLSTVAVYGLEASDTPITIEDSVAPKTAYGISKLQAEDEIRSLCDHTSTRYTIIRVPLVFGPAAPGNFGSLLRLAGSNLPLPFEAAGNRRTMVYVDNLADFIAHLVEKPPAVSATLLFSDGLVFGTDELLVRLRRFAGAPPRLFRVPRQLLKLGLGLSGRQKMYRQLFEDLVFEASPEVAASGWHPPVNKGDAFEAIARESHEADRLQ